MPKAIESGIATLEEIKPAITSRPAVSMPKTDVRDEVRFECMRSHTGPRRYLQSGKNGVDSPRRRIARRSSVFSQITLAAADVSKRVKAIGADGHRRRAASIRSPGTRQWE